MHAAILCATVFFSGFLHAPAPRVVEQTVEMVAIHHLENGSKFVFFFDFVQGQWTLLAHRWGFPDSGIYWTGEVWSFDFWDESDSCYRVIRAKCWAECWSEKTPARMKAGGRGLWACLNRA